ncbi:MAG: N-acetylmuramoyl-L-alanine amidase [Planctomycetota bacterium]
MLRLRTFTTLRFGVSACLLFVLTGCSPKVCTGYHVEDPVTPSPIVAPTKMTMDQALSRLDAADDWTTHPPLNLPRHPAEKYLEGWVIVLDPGHGGKSLETPGWKTGPTGVREAEMNLRVGLMLRELLEDAGAIVGMTRTEEVSDIADDRIGSYDHGQDADPNDPANWGTLQRRAHFANTFPRPENARPGGVPDGKGGFMGADLFISLHHNASSSPKSNYTTMWFHGPAEDALIELDAARHLAREVGYALRTDVGLTSPVMNDQQMFPTGFAVLRHATVPAVLTESSFFSNPKEEQRLDDPGYLLREAHAIYRGLCEMAYAGRPTQSLPEVQATAIGLVVKTELSDGQPAWWGHDLGRVLPESVAIGLDNLPNKSPARHGELTPTEQEPRTEMLESVLLVGSGGTAEIGWNELEFQTHEDGTRTHERVLTIQHQNFLKAHNWPQRYAVALKWEPGADLPEVVSVTPLGARR